MNEPIDEVIIHSNITNDDKHRILREFAKILADATGDNCACNINGNDEWLSYHCKYVNEYKCPHPGGAKCWEEYLLNLKYKSEVKDEVH